MALFNVPTDSEFVTPDRYLTRVALDWLNTLPFGEVIQDTRANRPKYPPSGNKNRLYRETDTTLVYISTGSDWIYFSGEYQRTQSQIAALVATLVLNDKGLIINVTDFRHHLVWGGSSLDFASGDDGSNYFIDAPSAPLGKTVQLCDGTATTFLKADGTLGNYTTKNLTGFYRKSVTTGADVTSAATAPTTQAHHHSVTVPDQNTADEALHTHSVTIANNINVTTGGGSNNAAAAQTVTTGAGSAHHHDVPSQTFNSADTTVIVNADGQPANYTVLTYFRR